MTAADFAGRIDHTLLRPQATEAKVDQLIAEALDCRFGAVCVAPVFVARAAGRLRGTGVRICTVAGFPNGTSKPVHKAIEASGLLKDGADEIDVVAYLPNLIAADASAARAELLDITRACRATRRDSVIKVIIESALLMTLGPERGEAAIAAACQAVRESGCDFVKTSTGFHPAGGATVEAVGLIKKHASGLLIKAAGGIRDLPTAKAMLDAGADRLGMSASVGVLGDFAKE